MTEEPAKRFTIDTLPWYTVPAALLGIPALVAILSLLWPEVFFDQFVEKYYWDPIKNDTGYNSINTATWALLMGLCLLGLTQMMEGLKIKLNNAVIYGAIAWVVTGANYRVMEDTIMFRPPLQYVMITPPIYLLFGAFGVLSLLVGLYIQRVAEATDRETAMQKLWSIQAALVLIYTLMWAADWSQVIIYLNPLLVAALVALNHFIVRYWVTKSDRVDARDMVSLFSIAPFLMSMAYVVFFISDPWSRSGTGIPSSFITAPLLAVLLTGVVWASARMAAKPKEEHNQAAWVIAGFSLALVGLLLFVTNQAGAEISLGSVGGLLFVAAALTGVGVFCARKLWANREEDKPGITTLAFLAPINLILISSQLMDAFATSMGLDLAGYEEKHVLSKYIIDAFHEFSISIGWEFGAAYPTFLAFVPLKLAVSVAVVYAIDVYSREDVAKYPTMIGFVKFAIIMVGIGPAVRDFVRLSLGV